MSDVLDINHRLLRLYGRDTVYDKPIYRIVWSEHLIEKREGEYEDYTPSGIYLGTKKGIREVPKYWYLAHPCWVLEKFHTIFARGTYDEVKEPYLFEPIFVFLDGNDNPLPLAWKAIEFVITAYNTAEANFKNVMEDKEKQTIKAEELKARDILEQEDEKWKPTFKSSVSVKEPEVKTRIIKP